LGGGDGLGTTLLLPLLVIILSRPSSSSRRLVAFVGDPVGETFTPPPPLLSLLSLLIPIPLSAEFDTDLRANVLRLLWSSPEGGPVIEAESALLYITASTRQYNV